MSEEINCNKNYCNGKMELKQKDVWTFSGVKDVYKCDTCKHTSLFPPGVNK
jgi:hypothetical protein